MARIFSVLLIFLWSTKIAFSNCQIPAPDINVQDVTACSMTIIWNSNINVSYYKVKYRLANSMIWIGEINVGTDTSIVLTELQSDKKYFIRVTPHCSSNEPGLTKRRSAQTLLCSDPINITIINITDSDAEINWTLCGGGTNNFIRYREFGATQWNLISTGSNTNFLLSSLDPMTNYELQVNSCDTSFATAWSQSNYFATLTLQNRPNILVICLDDCRYDVFQPNGGPSWFNSPAINSIANDGVNFVYCFPPLSLCSPSRASILTGLYPHDHGIFTNVNTDSLTIPIVADVLHESGYYTGFIGKYGFQKFPIPNWDYSFESSDNQYWNTNYDYNGANNVAIAGHKTELFTDKAIEFLNIVPASQKFILFVNHKAPHVPYEPRIQDAGIFDTVNITVPANFSLYEKNVPTHYYTCNYENSDSSDIIQQTKYYFELLAGVEYSVDSILSHLVYQGKLDSTLIIFTSDNGLLLGEHLLSGKEIALDESIRVPMYIRYPKWFSPNTVIENNMAMIIDIFPTILDAAGIADTFDLPGISLRKLADGTENRNELFYEFFYRYNCNPTLTAIRDFQYTYIQNDCAELTEEFYDLVSDSLQNINLINAPNYAGIVDEYRDKLDSLKIEFGYVNISDTIMPCMLAFLDSSEVFFRNSINSGLVNSPYSIYPNPSAGEINIISTNYGQTITEIDIVNIYGEVLENFKVDSKNHSTHEQIDVSMLPSALYFAIIRSESSQIALPFIKL